LSCIHLQSVTLTHTRNCCTCHGYLLFWPNPKEGRRN